MQETWVQFLGLEDPLKEEMAAHSSILAWKTPWTEESGQLQSMGWQLDMTSRLNTNNKGHKCTKLFSSLSARRNQSSWLETNFSSYKARGSTKGVYIANSAYVPLLPHIFATPRNSSLQPHHPEHSQFCLILEAKQGQAWLVHWKHWCWSWNSNTLATWCEELTHLKRPSCWEKLKAGGEGDDKGWDGWMTSPT